MKPILVNFRDTRVLVIGFGPIGQHKASVLFHEGATICVVDPRISEALMADHPEYTFKLKPYDVSDLEGLDFVVVATSDKTLNQLIAGEAKAKHLLCSVVSSGEESGFTFMSVVKRGDLTIGISTQHLFPGLTKKVRRQLEDYFPEDYGDYIAYMAAERLKILGIDTEDKDQLMKELMSISYEAYKQGRD